MTNDLEKEIELAEDLKGKLDKIEGKKPRRTKNKVETLSNRICSSQINLVRGVPRKFYKLD